MSSAIDFLERMGQDAQLREASMDDVAQALEEAQVESAVRQAILAKDATAIGKLLECSPLMAVQFPAEEGDEEEQDGEGDEEQISRCVAGFGLFSVVA